MNTLPTSTRRQLRLLRIGLGLAFVFSLNGCSTMPVPPASPRGNEIRRQGNMNIATTLLGPLLQGRPISVPEIINSVLYYQSYQYTASLEDQQYAIDIARKYKSKTDAPNLAVRTRASRHNPNPEVVVVSRTTGEVKSAYKLSEKPAAGQKIELQGNLMCEYVP